MKLIILRGNLKEALSAVERAVVDNQTLPVLKNIVLRAEARLTIQATNLEIGVTAVTSAKITEQGSICVPFAPLASVINASTNERIALSVEKNVLTVATDNYEAKIQGLPVEDFPIIPKLTSEEQTASFSAEVLKTALGQIISAAAPHDLKPELNSILLIVADSTVKCVATDGFRLAEKTIGHNAFATSIQGELKALIPLKTVQEAVRIFPNNEQITLAFDENQVLFSSKDITLISRLIDGAYPDYAAIIPRAVSSELVVEKEEFASAIKLVSSFSGKTSDIALSLAEEEKAVEISASNQLVGENRYRVALKKKKTEDFNRVVFNWKYLLDAVRVMPDGGVSLGFNGEGKPALLRSATDDSLLYIVMPIQQ